MTLDLVVEVMNENVRMSHLSRVDEVEKAASHTSRESESQGNAI